MRTLPAVDDVDARAALRRMMEVGTGVIVPAEELERNPLENAVALVSLVDAVASNGKVRERKRESGRPNGGGRKIFILIGPRADFFPH
jgi:hypothetical protein